MTSKIVVACPRSGTKYVSQLWNLHHEKDLGEEVDDLDGFCSWTLASTTESDERLLIEPYLISNFKEVVARYPNHEIIHQVRNPLDCIQSMTTIVQRYIWEFIQRNSEVVLTNSIINNCMQFWYYWNLQCEELTDKIQRLEDLPVDKKLDMNKRNHIILKWEDLEKEDKELCLKIKNMSERYGYERR